MIRRCFLDMDGVICDFVAGAAKLFGQDAAAVKTWDFPATWGLTAEEFRAPMGREFWAGLPLTPWAGDIVRALENEFGASNICILSTPCLDAAKLTPGCCDGKLDWIARHFPQLGSRFLLGPAKQFCSGFGCHLVDDSDANVEAWRAEGGTACLFPRPWNRMGGWDEMTIFREWVRAWHVDARRHQLAA